MFNGKKMALPLSFLAICSFGFPVVSSASTLVPTINIDNNERGFWNVEDTSDFEYKVANDELTITGYKGDKKEIEIPASIDGYTVVEIGEKAFMNQSIHTVSFAPGSHLEKIGDAAFASGKLVSVSLPNSLRVIGNSAFANNHLAYVTIPSSVLLIENFAFNQNNTSLIFESNVSDIELQDFALLNSNILLQKK